MTHIHARAGSLAAALTLALAAASPALAQDPPPADPAPAPEQPSSQAPPPPANGSLTLAVKKLYRDGPRRVALRRNRIKVQGRLEPVVAGQRVEIRFTRGRRVLAKRTVAVRDGAFSLRRRVRWTGDLRVRAVHKASPEVGRAASPRIRFLAVRPKAGPGSRGAVVRVLQRSLRRMRYAARLTGVYDSATADAVMAWRKVNGRRRVWSAGRGVVRAIAARRGAYRVRHRVRGNHAEADLSRQIMALVERGKLHRVYHVSSGAPSTPTIRGRFSVYRKDPGTNSLGMVHSTYFRGGYAVHGYKSVPTYPASHGCLRVPIRDAWAIYNWFGHGDRVIVDP